MESSTPPNSVWITVSDAEALEAALPTAAEREEWESLEASRPSVPADPAEIRAYGETRARRAELGRKIRNAGGVVTEVGDDFVAWRSGDGEVNQLPLHSIGQITSSHDAVARVSSPESKRAGEQGESRRLMNQLAEGTEVVLRASDQNTFDLFIGMDAELRDRVATAEERAEYEELSQLDESEPLFLAIPDFGGDRDAARRQLEESRRKQNEKVERRARLAELKPRVAFQAIRITEVGDDYFAFESGEGLTTSIAASRISTVTRRATPQAK